MRLATYIVRIYRLRKDKPRGILGVVERVGVKGRKAFTDCDELWEILSCSISIKTHKKRGNAIILMKKKANWGSKL